MEDLLFSLNFPADKSRRILRNGLGARPHVLRPHVLRPHEEEEWSSPAVSEGDEGFCAAARRDRNQDVDRNATRQGGAVAAAVAVHQPIAGGTTPFVCRNSAVGQTTCARTARTHMAPAPIPS